MLAASEAATAALCQASDVVGLDFLPAGLWPDRHRLLETGASVRRAGSCSLAADQEAGGGLCRVAAALLAFACQPCHGVLWGGELGGGRPSDKALLGTLV